MAFNTVETALSFVTKLPGLLRSLQSDSLIEYTKPTRVEPIVLLDDRVVHLALMPDLMQGLTMLFSGYYLQAVALSVNVGNVDIIHTLDKVNPNRSVPDNLESLLNLNLRSSHESADSYKYALPYFNQPIGLEAFGHEATTVIKDNDRVEIDSLNVDNTTVNNITKGESGKSFSEFGVGKDTIKLAQDVSNLSAGKLLEVNIESDGYKASFPVMVRLITTSAPPNAITSLLSVNNLPRTVKERWHGWRSGQLRFIEDLVLCQDLIDAHKKALIKDPANIYSTSLKRRHKNRLSAILSGEPSVATASNIIVIDDSTRKDVERKIGGRLKDYKTREKVFASTYTMLLVVVNSEWDMVTVYHRSIETPSELSARDLKSGAKSKGSEVEEILKAYVMGNSPTI